MFAAIFGILGLTYALWGAALMLLFCVVFGQKFDGIIIQRVYRSFFAAVIATAVFTPAGFGTTGFGFFIPWFIAIFFEKQFVMISSALFLITFGIAFTITFLATFIPNKTEPDAGAQ